jgi:hypothetical protein
MLSYLLAWVIFLVISGGTFILYSGRHVLFQGLFWWFPFVSGGWMLVRNEGSGFGVGLMLAVMLIPVLYGFGWSAGTSFWSVVFRI